MRGKIGSTSEARRLVRASVPSGRFDCAMLSPDIWRLIFDDTERSRDGADERDEDCVDDIIGKDALGRNVDATLSCVCSNGNGGMVGSTVGRGLSTVCSSGVGAGDMAGNGRSSRRRRSIRNL